MPTLTPERIEEIVDGWRRGEDLLDGPENPAGPLFHAGGYAESEITMTGPGGPGGPGITPCGTGCSASMDPTTGIIYQCC